MSIEVFRVRLRTNSRPLAANESWEQGWQDTYGNEHDHRRVRVDIWADKAGTLYLDQSDAEDHSGVTSTTVSVSAATRTELAWVTISKRFYRVRYVNGGTANVKEPQILLERSALSTADNSLAGVAQDGTDATGVAAPTGAVGIRGWLSGIYNLLFGGGAKVTVTGSNLTESTPLPVAGTDGTTLKVPFVSSAGDNAALNTTSAAGMLNFSLGYAYNEGRYDRWRNNTEGTLLASAARTAATASPNQTNYNARGVMLFLNVTAASGTGGLQVYIYGDAPSSSSGWLLQASAITATGQYVYELYPGASTAGGAGSGRITQRVAGALPRAWHAYVSVGDGSSYTYSLAYSLIV